MQRANNPTGRNQHKDCPPKDSEQVNDVLRRYHNSGQTNRVTVSGLLRTVHGIQMSSATVARRWNSMGLKGSTATSRDLPDETKRQYVLDACAEDPAGRQGPGSIRENIRLKTGVHLTFKSVRNEMRAAHPAGFSARDPNSKKLVRSSLTSPGPHAEWSADGHDKFKEQGFPIWGIRDKWSRQWIGLWVIPCNRTLEIVAYCYLSAILDLGGRPRQSTTDCGSETTLIFGLANALAALSFTPVNLPGPEPNHEQPVHQFLKSVRNITIERGWVSLKMSVIDNLRVFWDAGSHLVNRADPHQKELVNWLWSKFIQEQLDDFRAKMNAHRPRVNKDQLLPSGLSPNECMERYVQLGAEWCLQHVDLELVRCLREELGGEQLIYFNTLEYRTVAQRVFDSLSIGRISGNSIWGIYQEMLPRMRQVVVLVDAL
ncbi:hypothetical protein H1R20_g1901, partial [Candolleomyces eurysporus]